MEANDAPKGVDSTDKVDAVEKEVIQEAPKVRIEDFQKIQLRVGTVLEATEHPDADRLLVMKVDLGEEKPRQLVAGIKSRYAPEDLVGRQVVVVANLKPAKLRGVESQGMILAASDDEGVSILNPERQLAAGSPVR